MTITLEMAYAWLNMYVPKGTFLSEATQQMLELAEQAMLRGDVERTLSLLRHMCAINTLGRVSDLPEIAETRLKCGRIYYKLGHYQKASQMLGEAVGRYTAHPHQHAVAKWMRGCVWTHYPEMRDNVIVEWRQSCKEFEQQSSGVTTNKEQADWYRKRYQEMQEAIKLLIRQDGAGDAARHALEGWTVIDQIPANFTVQKQLVPYIKGKVVIENLEIERRPYLLKHYPNSLTTAVELKRAHYVLKVSDDTMDKQGIEAGSYVLLRPFNEAVDNDIVAVEMVGKDTNARLRRCTLKGKQITLSAESSNPAHKPHSFPVGANNDYRIYGVVVGVFKPA